MFRPYDDILNAEVKFEAANDGKDRLYYLFVEDSTRPISATMIPADEPHPYEKARERFQDAVNRKGLKNAYMMATTGGELLNPESASISQLIQDWLGPGYVSEYNWDFTTPLEHEFAMLEDFYHGLLSDIEDFLKKNGYELVKKDD